MEPRQRSDNQSDSDSGPVRIGSPAVSVTLTTQSSKADLDAFEQVSALADIACGSGARRLWVNEFHSASPPYLPPVPLLAHLAGRHPGMSLGTAVLVPSLHQGKLLAEEIGALSCMVDDLAIGVGAGYEQDHDLLGASRPDVAGLATAVASLNHELAASPRVWRGQRPPVMYVGTASLRTISALSPHVDGLLLHPSQPPGAIREQIAAFRASGGRHVCLMRDVVVQPSREDAKALAQAMVESKHRNYLRLGRSVVDERGRPLAAQEVTLDSTADRVIVGDGDDLRTALDEIALLGIDEVAMRLTYSDWPFETSRSAMEVFRAALSPAMATEGRGTPAVGPLPERSDA